MIDSSRRIPCPEVLSIDEIQDLIYNAKDTLASLLNVDKSITDLSIEFSRINFEKNCRTKNDVVIFVAKLLAKKDPNIKTLINKRYQRMEQAAWNLLDTKFNFGAYILFPPKNIQIETSIFVSVEDLIERLMSRIAISGMNNFYVHKIQEYYYNKFNISNVITTFLNLLSDEVSIINIQNNELVLTKFYDTIFPSIHLACIRNQLRLASPDQIDNAISTKVPCYNKYGINIRRIGMTYRTYHTMGCLDSNVDLISELVKARVINTQIFDYDLYRMSIQLKKEEEDQIRKKYITAAHILSDQNIIYNKNNILYVLDSSGIINAQKYDITIDSCIINRPIKKCMQRLIDTNFFGKLSCNPKNVNPIFLENAIARIITSNHPSKISLDEIVDELKVYDVFKPILSGNSLNDYFSVTYIDKSIDIIPAYNSKTDTFYKMNKAFDYVTIDLSAGTMNRIPVTYEEGIEVIKRFQSEIASYALDVIIKSRKLNKYNIPRNMFRLDDMVYIKSQEFIRVWFGIKGVK